jgi:hypothetical protein
LIDRAVSDVANVFGHDVSEQLPVAEMAQDDYDRSTRAQLSMYNVQVFRLDSCRDLFQRHNAKFDAAQKIPAQPLEMAAHQTAQFSR